MSVTMSPKLQQARSAILVELDQLEAATSDQDWDNPNLIVDGQTSGMLSRMTHMLKAFGADSDPQNPDAQSRFKLQNFIKSAESFMDDVSARTSMASVAIVPFLPAHLKVAALGIAAAINSLDGTLKLLKESSDAMDMASSQSMAAELKQSSQDIFMQLEMLASAQEDELEQMQNSPASRERMAEGVSQALSEIAGQFTSQDQAAPIQQWNSPTMG